MAKLRFVKYVIFVLVAIFCTSASSSTDLPARGKSQTQDTPRLRRNGADNKLKDGCVLPPTTPDKTYTITCPTKENCGTKPGEQVAQFTVMTSKCNPGYGQYQNGGASNDVTLINACFNGTWAIEVPKCKRICKKLSSEELDLTCYLYLNGPRVPCNSTLLEGAVVKPRCKPRYHTDSNASRSDVTCQADGSWDKGFFKCVNDCGRTRASVVKLITYGSTEKRGQAPWYVAVYSTETSKEPSFICGGTLISPEFVVSSALCFYDLAYRKKLDPKLVSLVVAKQTIDYKKQDYSTTKQYSVKAIHFPDTALFNTYGLNYESNLALLQLSEPITLSDDVLPACIYWDEKERFDPRDGIIGKVSGFGYTEEEKLATELKTTNLPYINFTECVKQVREDSRDILTFDSFCAGSESTGPRPGDSGGGLLFLDSKDGRYYLRGVVSAREYRSNSSITTFTDISLHTPWIKKIVPTFNQK